MASKRKFKDVSSEIINSTYDMVRILDDNSLRFEDSADEDNGMIGRVLVRLKKVNVEFWIVLNKDCDWQYMTVAKMCPLNDGFNQDYTEINTANDELTGVKVSLCEDDEDELVLLSVETNLELIDRDKYGIAVQLSLMTLLDAIKKLQKKKIISGLSDFLKLVR